MISARHLGKKTALCAIALALGWSAAAVASPAAGIHRGLESLGPHPASASTRTLTALHNFNGITDGSAPVGNLDLALTFGFGGGTRTLYGVTQGGGSAASGTIYSDLLGAGTFTTVYSFLAGNDGAFPAAGLATNDTNYALAGALQLGITDSAGAGGYGTVFAIAPNGTLIPVHAFTGGNDGSFPSGRITRFVDGNYYGTTSSGGAYGYGTVFQITPAGVFSTIYAFTGGADGGAPRGGLALNVKLGDHDRLTPSLARSASLSGLRVAPYLYGTTSTGASGLSGTIFRITPTGHLKTLYTFTGGNDGGVPVAKLATDYHGNLFGTTSVGGVQQNGVIFRVSQSGSYGVIYDFGDGTKGADPEAQLTFGFDGNLYGTASSGGALGYGDIFELSRSGFADIHDFALTDGATPLGSLVDGGDGNLYGTASAGGPFGGGVLFSITE